MSNSNATPSSTGSQAHQPTVDVDSTSTVGWCAWDPVALARRPHVGLNFLKSVDPLFGPLTTARAMDHFIRMIIEMQKTTRQTAFSPAVPNVEIWRGLDVLAQRWAALEYILTKQSQEPGIPIAKVWSSLKSFELEPPIAMTTIKGDRLQAAQSQAATESKLFGALGKQKD